MNHYTLNDLVEGLEAVDDFQVTSQDMEAFALLSGDRNPLHLDCEAAAERGFERPLVYGGLLVAHLSRMIGMELPGNGAVWTDLKISFHGPLYVGENAKLVAQVASVHAATLTARLKFRIMKLSGALVAMGQIGVFLGNVG